MADENMEIEKKLCLEIFPNEIWENILCKVKEVSDYFQISSASYHLRTILLEFCAPEILFPEVAYPLLQKFTKRRVGFVSKEITPLRKVCSAWRRGVDGVLQNPDNFAHTPMINEDEDFIPDNQVDRFGDAEDCSRFEKHFDSTHLAECNPFLGKCVIFSIGEDQDEDLSEFFRASLQLLTKYGQHIRYCGIHVSMWNPFDRVAFYNRLPELLSKLPNLQAFDLYDFFADNIQIPDNAVAEQTFPELPQLRRLYLYGPPIQVVKGIVAKSPQIQNLQIVGSQSAGTVRAYMALPNVEVLCVELRERDQAFEPFRRGQFASKSVKTLRLNMIPMDGRVSWKTTFRILKTHFAESLEDLNLRLCQPKPQNMFLRRGLALANLKMLRLELDVPVPLNFILPMASHLEKISVATIVDEESEIFQAAQRAENRVKVYQFCKQLEKSNVWTVFPKLKLMGLLIGSRLDGPCYLCTRDQWKAFESGK